jgi:hypothetical protein
MSRCGRSPTSIDNSAGAGRQEDAEGPAKIQELRYAAGGRGGLGLVLRLLIRADR